MIHEKKRILEVIVMSAEEAILAQRGGADRLELIRDFQAGGLTPSVQLVSEVLAAVDIPVRVMVREQANFSVSDDSEIANLRDILASLTALKVDGVVLGFIKEGIIDTCAIGKLLHGHNNLKVTFHRAFEATNNPVEAIEALRNFPQIDRILTNGGGGEAGGEAGGDGANGSTNVSWGSTTWEQRIKRMHSWQQIAKPIDVLVGGEVDFNSLQLLKETELREFHVGRSARTPETTSGKIDTTKIEKMRITLD